MKKFLAILAAALMVLTCTVAALAATEPQLTNDTKVYIGFNVGNNDYSGLTPEEPKKQWLYLEDNGAVSLLKDGGTMVAVGKLYIGGDYELPELGSTLKITSFDGNKNFKNSFPIENPYCAMKMQKGATLTLQSDVIIEDIILFQEHALGPGFHVTNNSTLVMGDKIDTITNINVENAPYYVIDVDKGSTLILKSGTYQNVTGEGTVVNQGATILEGAYATEGAKPAETEAPAKTEAAEVVAAPETTAAVAETGAETTAAETADAAETTAAAEAAETVAAPADETVPATEEAAPETTAAAAEPAAKGAGAPIALIVGIAAAVIVVAAVVVAIVKKKKK
ncbi:MAG: hypothetical protein IJU41_05965 [Clostridia bacterium]|nr:hypothetical protein [Clostridia bacterium]